MNERRILTNWNNLRGKTVERVTFHNHFERNTIALIFTDGTYALMESSLPQSEIILKEK